MKSMIFWSSLAIAAVTPVVASSAADLAPIYRGPPPIAYNWTGCYIGAQGGGGAQFDSFTGKDGTGEFLGGQGGCNFQINNFVVGIEGEGVWSDIRSRADLTVLVPGGASSVSTETNKSFTDVSVRFGYTFFDRTLIYGKLGAVWTRQNFNLISNAPASITANWTAGGVLLGFGFEYAVTDRWIARLETDFLLFDAVDPTFNTTGGLLPTTQTVNSFDIVTKLALSYKFY